MLFQAWRIGGGDFVGFIWGVELGQEAGFGFRDYIQEDLEKPNVDGPGEMIYQVTISPSLYKFTEYRSVFANTI